MNVSGLLGHAAALACAGHTGVAVQGITTVPVPVLLQPLWDTVVHAGLLANPMLEAYVASFSFLLWIFVFSLVVVATKNGADEVPFIAKHGLLKRFANAVTPARADHSGREMLSLPVYVAAVYILHIFKAKTRPLNEEVAPTVVRFGVELVMGIVAYDAIFFAIHMLLHRCQWLYDNVHATHHTHPKGMGAATTVAHSFWDGALQVATNILVQHMSPTGWGQKHTMTRLAHNIIITYMLAEIHSGYDAPWCLHNLAPSIVGGGLRHRYHHLYTTAGFKGRKGVHYQEFFRYLDDWWGTSVGDEECRAARHIREPGLVFTTPDNGTILAAKLCFAVFCCAMLYCAAQH